jgi:beta-lactamase class A
MANRRDRDGSARVRRVKAKDDPPRARRRAEQADGGPPVVVRERRTPTGRRQVERRHVRPRPAPVPASAVVPGSEGKSVARAEVSLYQSVLRIREEHGLERLGISFYDAETSLQWAYGADVWFHAASTMKLAVLLGVFHEVERGRLRLDETVHVRNKFRSVVDGSPFTLDLNRDADSVVYAHLGRTMTVHQLAYQMIITSSNFATNLLVDVVGVPTIDKALADIGVRGIRVRRGVEDQLAFNANINNEVTANGLLGLLRAIADGEACSPKACEQMLAIMLDQRFRSGIPAGLPQAARVAHKTGNITTVHHDAGIVYLEDRKPYVLVVLTQFAADKGRGTAVAAVSRDIYECLAGIQCR